MKRAVRTIALRTRVVGEAAWAYLNLKMSEVHEPLPPLDQEMVKVAEVCLASGRIDDGLD